jgi:two-component system, cell cycle response regulator
MRSTGAGTSISDIPAAPPAAGASRRWYHLEDRHAWLFRARAVSLVAIGAAAAVLPREASERDHLLAAAACLLALILHAALELVPRVRPRMLLAAHDAGLVVDAALIFALAELSGGLDGLGLWVLPLQALAMTLGYSLASGIKALILGAIVIGALYALESPGAPPLGEVAGPPVMAVAVVVIAGVIDRVNRADLRRQADRDRAKWSVSTELIAATSAEEVLGIVRPVAEDLLEGFEVAVELSEGAEPVVRTWREDGRAIVAVPLVADGEGGSRALGTITASRALPRLGRVSVRGRDLDAVRRIAADAAAAIVRIEGVEQLERLSLADPLTGLGNRRAFDDALREELARTSRSGAPLGLVMLDVDHFKDFNDRHGHQAGDEALVAVAEALRGAARAEDRACRIGGEEFALLLPGAAEAAAAAVAERVRAAVAADTRPAGRLTVSLGVAAAGPGATAEGLVQQADLRLYAAKEGGRDRVVARRG